MNLIYFLILYILLINNILAQSDTLQIHNYKLIPLLPTTSHSKPPVQIYKVRVDSFQYKLFNAQGQEILTSLDEPFYDRHLYYNKQSEFYRIRCGRKYGIINREGRLILALEYDKIKPYKGEYEMYWDYQLKKILFEVTRNKKIGLVDTLGNPMVPCYYDGIQLMQTQSRWNNFWIVWNDGKKGILDSLGREILPCIYEGVGYEENAGMTQLTIIKMNGKYGALSWNNNPIIACLYDRLYFGGSIGVACRAGTCGLIDTFGREIAPFLPATQIYHFSEGFALIRKDSLGKDEKGKNKLITRHGFLDSTGREITNFKYHGAYHFSEGLATVSYEDGYIRFIDTTGKEVIVTDFKHVHDFKEGFAKVCDGGGCGFLNRKGMVVVPLKYDDVQPFHGGMAWVQLKDKKGLVNTSGKEITGFKYKQVASASEGLASVWDADDNIRVIDTTGKEIFATQFKYISQFQEGFAMAFDGKLHGFINTKGETIIPFQYNEVRPFKNGKAWVQLKDKKFFINTKGEEIKE